MTAAQSDRRGRQWVTFVHLQFVFHSNEKTNGNVPFVLSNEKTNGKWNKVFLSFYSVCSLSENKETLFPLSIYAYLNKYRRCCILRKVRPLQIVTTSSFTELFSSLFLIEANLCWFFSKNKQRSTHLKHVGNIPLVSGGWMSCLFRLDTSQQGFCCLGDFWTKIVSSSHIWGGVGFLSGQPGSSTLSYLLSLSLKTWNFQWQP